LEELSWELVAGQWLHIAALWKYAIAAEAEQQQTSVVTARHIASKEAMENLKILFIH